MEDAEQYLVASFRELSADQHADQDAKKKARDRVARFYVDRGQRQKFDELLRDMASGTPRVN